MDLDAGNSQKHKKFLKFFQEAREIFWVLCENNYIYIIIYFIIYMHIWGKMEWNTIHCT